MTATKSFHALQKTSIIWSSRRESQIAVRIYYQVRIENDCRMYHLTQLEELDF
ncbi:MAG: hypothetical protein M3Z09_08605 [Acidobacteriota bacterium]|nr:hypothetical protein [Acidobacteriota bacterium]